MNITINGVSKSFPNPFITISVLLKECNVENPQLVTVQHNGNFVDRKQYVAEIVRENDDVDFLYFLGGGGL